MTLDSVTHASLVQRLARPGDPADADAAWLTFLDRYGPLLRGFCRRHDLGPAETDDVIQDVLLALTKALPGFTYDPARGKFRGYLKTVVLHAVYRRICQKRADLPLDQVESAAHAQARTASGDPATEAMWEQEWRQHHLTRAMRTLDAEASPRDRAVFEAYALAGQPVEAVAGAHGLSTDAVYQIKSRLLKRLSALIQQQVDDEG